MGTAEPDSGSLFSITLSIVLLGLGLLIAAAHAAAALTFFLAATLTLMIAVRALGAVALFRLDIELAVGQDRLFPGETLELTASLSNRKPLPVWIRLELPRPGALEASSDSESSGSIGLIEGETGLLPYERSKGSWRFKALRRGAFTLGPAALSAGDPMGLARRERSVPVPSQIVVFPRLVPIHSQSLPFRDYFGIHPAKGIIEDPAWYEGTREYTGNRPARSIHWKASARLGILQEKIFEPTSHLKVFFLLIGRGFETSGDEAGFESALEIVASMVAGLAEEGASFAVATDRLVPGFPAVLPLGRGPEHLGRSLELLARSRLESGQEIPPLLSHVGTSGAGFVIVSRQPDEGSARFFSLPSSRKHRALFVFAERPSLLETDKAALAADYPSISFGDLLEGRADGPGTMERRR